MAWPVYFTIVSGMPVGLTTRSIHGTTQNMYRASWKMITSKSCGIGPYTASTLCSQANKPDLVLFDKTNEIIHIIEFSVPFSSNVNDKIQEKHTKYADLAYEMSRLHPKYKVIRLPKYSRCPRFGTA